MLDLAQRKGTAVLNAAPYAGGVLAKGTSNYHYYVYQEASDKMLDPIRRIEAICAKHKIPPGAAALQFSMRDPRIAATICGVTKPERVHETLEWAAWPIPEEAWTELLALPYSTRRPGSDTRLQARVSQRYGSSRTAGKLLAMRGPSARPGSSVPGAWHRFAACSIPPNRFARSCKQLSALAKVQSVIFIWE